MIQKIKKYSTTNTLVVLGIIVGILFGSFLPDLALKQQVIGQMFISFLKMLVVPLVFASIYVAILGLGNLKDLKTIGLRNHKSLSPYNCSCCCSCYTGYEYFSYRRSCFCRRFRVFKGE